MVSVSVVLIVPAARRQDGHDTAIGLTHDVTPGNTYNVPLSPTGQEPVTHYGTHWWDHDDKWAWLDDIKAGRPVGSVEQAKSNRLGAAIMSSSRPIDEISPREHFDTFAATHNLSEIVPEIEVQSEGAKSARS